VQVQHGLVKTLLGLSLVGCSSQAFNLPGEQLAAAEQRAFDRIMQSRSSAEILFIAHEWRAGACHWTGWKRAACVTQARGSPQAPWIKVTARLERQGEAWVLLGADWPGK